MPEIPLHTDAAADPARRRAIVSSFDLDAAIQVHRAFTVLVIAEGLDGQWQQGRPLFGEHGSDLPLGGAMDARVGPARFPMVQVGLRLFRSGRARWAVAARPAALRRTWQRPAAWWFHGCACRPSALPNGPGRPAPLPIWKGSMGSGSKAGRSSANMAATCRLVVPWMRVSAQRASQWSR